MELKAGAIRLPAIDMAIGFVPRVKKKLKLKSQSKNGSTVMMNDKSKIFSILCEHSCRIMDGWIPYPSTAIQASMPSLTLYSIRKYLKELKNEGLIDSDLYVEQGEERPILIRGWVVTDKGKLTAEYKLAHEVERRICRECFELDIGELN